MRKTLINIFLKINSLFPEKNHPFNNSSNGVYDLNYTDFEYKHTPDLLKQYSKIIDLDILKNKKILDIGCGGGGKSIYIAEKYNSEITGIDLNLTFLKEANKKIKEKGLEKQVFLKKQSALDMSFENETFDIIIMSDVIEHIPNTQKLFDEVYRVLKKGGYVIFDFAPYYHYFGHHIWDTIRIPWIHLFTSESFRIELYKQSLKSKVDKDKRLDLRIGLVNGKQKFVYLNQITRKKFENIVASQKKHYCEDKINYYMLKNMNFLSKIPLFREIFIRHIVGYLKK